MSRPTTDHHRGRRAAALAIAAALSGLGLADPVGATPADDRDSDRSVLTARPGRVQPIEITWTAAGGSAPTDLTTAASAPDAGPLTGTMTAVPAGPTADTIPLDDIVSNHGCAMVEPDPGQHAGVNCIDEGWLNTDGTIYVHTTTPASISVAISDDPDATPGFGGIPFHESSEYDSSPTADAQEFTSRAFAIEPATTYFVTAWAIDSEGALSWRAGTAHVPHAARVRFDTLTVLNDGDEYSWNWGEISLAFGVDDEILYEPPWDYFDDGDTYDPPVETLVAGSPSSVDVWVTANEDDPGTCVVEATFDVDDYQDGGGCHFAKAFETFDLSGAPTPIEFDFTSPDEHLRIRIEGEITFVIP